MIKPIIIIGVPRSGTTLLRVILDSHSRIVAVPETPWILGGYGPVSIRELINNLIEHKTGPVKNLIGVTDATIYAAIKEFINEILSPYLQTKQKDYLVLKTPDDVQYLEFLIRLYPDSTYIHIFRDGRDVASSTIKKKGEAFGNIIRGYGELNFENAMRRWYDWELKIRQTLVANKNISCISIRYEDLVNSPTDIVRAVCSAINIEFENSMLDYNMREHDYPLWEAGSQDVKSKFTIDKTCIGKWKTAVSEIEIAKVEAMYGKFLVELGYSLSQSDKKTNVTSATRVGMKNLINYVSRYCSRFKGLM